jgi:hypothetical protein
MKTDDEQSTLTERLAEAYPAFDWTDHSNNQISPEDPHWHFYNCFPWEQSGTSWFPTDDRNNPDLHPEIAETYEYDLWLKVPAIDDDPYEPEGALWAIENYAVAPMTYWASLGRVETWVPDIEKANTYDSRYEAEQFIKTRPLTARARQIIS